jgi:hypothetical protein
VIDEPPIVVLIPEAFSIVPQHQMYSVIPDSAKAEIATDPEALMPTPALWILVSSQLNDFIWCGELL